MVEKVALECMLYCLPIVFCVMPIVSKDGSNMLTKSCHGIHCTSIRSSGFIASAYGSKLSVSCNP